MQAGFEEHYQFLLGTLETLKQDPVNPCLVSKNILNLFIYEKKVMLLFLDRYAKIIIHQ